MVMHRKFILTGQDRHGNNAIVETDSRDTADNRVVSWKLSGFADVTMTERPQAISPKPATK